MATTDIIRNRQTQAQTAEISPKYPIQRTGTAPTVWGAAVTLGAYTKELLIINTHGTNELRVVFPTRGGWNANTAYTPIAPGQNLNFQVRVDRVRLLGSAAGTTYRILASEELGD
ncbi:unnamed protein product [marine sediment metagenome]|uniref:Uncharacterized protein n=1 Tax=marine sediment metagenome TaxID=412755 RepID=X0WPW1_9ZZZZ